MCVSRCGAIYSGVFSLVCGLIWLAAYIIGLMAFKCDFEVNNDVVNIFLDVYFNHGSCEGATHSELDDFLKDSSITNLDFNIYATNTYLPTYPTSDPFHEWPRSTIASERTQILLVIYVVLTACWILSSMMLTIGASIDSKGPIALIFYLPWISITFIMCVTDVVATILYALDIPKTMTVLDFLKFIGLNTSILEELPNSQKLSEPQIFTTIPAVVMILICSKFILIWLFNLILLLTTSLALRNNITNYKRNENKLKEGEWRSASKLWLTEPLPRKDSTESTTGEGGSNPWGMRPKKSSPPARKYDMSSNANLNVQPFHNFIRAEEEGRSSFRDNGPPPDELRNELPWSYFSHRDDLKGPPKRNKNVLEPMPPVPPPDYTLKFPQYTRPIIHRNSDYRSSWSSKDGFPTAHEPFIPAPDYEKKRLPTRMVGRQTSQESNNSRALKHGTKGTPHIPQPDYEIREAPPSIIKPTMKQELQAKVAARGHSNLSYLSTEDDGYRQPHIPTPDYAKPRKLKSSLDVLGSRPNNFSGMENSPFRISGDPNKVTGRSRHYGYF